MGDLVVCPIYRRNVSQSSSWVVLTNFGLVRCVCLILCDLSWIVPTRTQNRRWTCRVLTSPCTSCRFPLYKTNDAQLSATLSRARENGQQQQRAERTGKLRSYFRRDNAKHSKVRLVPNDHGDNMWARVLAQLFDPGLEVAKGRGLCHVVY